METIGTITKYSPIFIQKMSAKHKCILLKFAQLKNGLYSSYINRLSGIWVEVVSVYKHLGLGIN